MKMINSMVARLSVLGLVVSCFGVAVLAQTTNSGQLNGTYRIDRAKSDNVTAMVESIARTNGLSQDTKSVLEDQLKAPEIVTIRTSRSNPDSVTVSTSSTSETTFQADGRSQVIRQDDGSQVNVTATLRNGVLRLSRVGSNSSFSISFATESNGSALRVTRMITTEYLDNTVYADSFYNRDGGSSSTVLDDDDVPYKDDDAPSNDDDSDVGYSSSDPNDSGRNSTTSSDKSYPKTRKVNGRFVVPKGVVLTGSLNSKVTTKSSQNNDRFTMTIESPYEYNGAEIEGYLSGIKRTGRASGRSRLTFNFETIRLKSGEVYDFAGVLQSVTDSTGKVIDIGEEGDAKSKSKTKESVKRGGIGAGLGAIIGGILGGGKGAIIGATIGGGAGAGSVIAEGREDIELLPGSTVKVESSSPNTDIR